MQFIIEWTQYTNTNLPNCLQHPFYRTSTVGVEHPDHMVPRIVWWYSSNGHVVVDSIPVPSYEYIRTLLVPDPVWEPLGELSIKLNEKNRERKH